MPPKTAPGTLGTLYTASAIATGELLDERVRTIDGSLDIVLAKPKELGGGDGRGNNPFQLLAAAYSASFHAALQSIFPRETPKFPLSAAVQATVAFGLRPDGGFGLEIVLDIKLPGIERTYAETLIEKARHICSVCDATRKEVLQIKLAETLPEIE
jgi:Ohr subfamily peroxiredoxin